MRRRQMTVQPVRKARIALPARQPGALGQSGPPDVFMPLRRGEEVDAIRVWRLGVSLAHAEDVRGHQILEQPWQAVIDVLLPPLVASHDGGIVEGNHGAKSTLSLGRAPHDGRLSADRPAGLSIIAAAPPSMPYAGTPMPACRLTWRGEWAAVKLCLCLAWGHTTAGPCPSVHLPPLRERFRVGAFSRRTLRDRVAV